MIIDELNVSSPSQFVLVIVTLSAMLPSCPLLIYFYVYIKYGRGPALVFV